VFGLRLRTISDAIDNATISQLPFVCTSSYDLLCDILRESLERDPEMAELRGGYITPDTCVFMTLRWLAGGSYVDIMLATGIKKPSYVQALEAVVETVRRQ
jgi:hypothetical protein